MQNFTDSWVKTKKKKKNVSIAKSEKKTFFSKNSGVKSKNKTKKNNQKKGLHREICEKRFLLTDSEVLTSILGVSSFELHSRGTEPVTFLGAQPSLEGAQFSFGGAQAVIWGEQLGPEISPLAQGLECDKQIDYFRAYKSLDRKVSKLNTACHRALMVKPSLI